MHTGPLCELERGWWPLVVPSCRSRSSATLEENKFLPALAWTNPWRLAWPVSSAFQPGVVERPGSLPSPVPEGRVFESAASQNQGCKVRAVLQSKRTDAGQASKKSSCALRAVMEEPSQGVRKALLGHEG